MAEEILNVEYNLILLIEKALNKLYEHKKVAEALGCCTKQVSRYIKRFDIRYDWDNKVYKSHSRILILQKTAA